MTDMNDALTLPLKEDRVIVASPNLAVYMCLVGEMEVPEHRMIHLSRESTPLRLIYPLWVIVRDGYVTVVDTGFSAEVAAMRGVQRHRDPAVLLASLGVDAGDVSEVLITHLHFDHFSGGSMRFPTARFVIQESDSEYFLGRGMHHPAAGVADLGTAEDIDHLRATNRLELIHGDAMTSAAHLSLIGGHTPGSQIVQIRDTPVPIVLAGDGAHLYRNLKDRNPSSLIHSYDAYQLGFNTIETLSHGGTWFPGHDPSMLSSLIEIEPGIHQMPLGSPLKSGSSEGLSTEINRIGVQL